MTLGRLYTALPVPDSCMESMYSFSIIESTKEKVKEDCRFHTRADDFVTEHIYMYHDGTKELTRSKFHHHCVRSLLSQYTYGDKPHTLIRCALTRVLANYPTYELITEKEARINKTGSNRRLSSISGKYEYTIFGTNDVRRYSVQTPRGETFAENSPFRSIIIKIVWQQRIIEEQLLRYYPKEILERLVLRKQPETGVISTLIETRLGESLNTIKGFKYQHTNIVWDMIATSFIATPYCAHLAGVEDPIAGISFNEWQRRDYIHRGSSHNTMSQTNFDQYLLPFSLIRNYHTPVYLHSGHAPNWKFYYCNVILSEKANGLNPKLGEYYISIHRILSRLKDLNEKEEITD